MGIGEVQGDQTMARQCYVSAFQQSASTKSIAIGPVETSDPLDDQSTAEPRDHLIEIEINKDGGTICIGHNLPITLFNKLSRFVKENNDVFAWKLSDMPGIELSVITH